MKEIWRAIRHNQGLFVALMICAGFLLWTFGCESKVTSLVTPDKQVTRQELDLELASESRRLESQLDQLIKAAELKNQQLDRQDEIKRKIFEFAEVTAAEGTINPVGAIGLLGTILTGGLFIDNRRKDTVIKNRPNPAKTTT